MYFTVLHLFLMHDLKILLTFTVKCDLISMKGAYYPHCFTFEVFLNLLKIFFYYNSFLICEVKCLLTETAESCLTAPHVLPSFFIVLKL